MKSNPIIVKKGPGPALPGRGARTAIPGVFPSTSRFGEQVVKLRTPSLDTYIGGGIPIGGICLIKDEFPSRFGDMVLKSFVADGATYNHRLYVASRFVSPEDFTNSLPSLKKSSNEPFGGAKTFEDEDMKSADLKIAWRYGQQPQNPAGLETKLQKNVDQNLSGFDFSKSTSVHELGGKNLFLSKCCTAPTMESTSLTSFSGNEMLREILEVVDGLQVDQAKQAPSNVARICISFCDEQVLLDNFMWKLRSIVQHTNSCAVIIMSDATLKKYKLLLPVVENQADIVISLRTIVDQKYRNDLGGIDGVCDIEKVASNNTLKIFEPPKDIGLSFKKKRILFHELHLPPEGETTAQREASSATRSTTTTTKAAASTDSMCTPILGKSLDF